ncbi:hypothetical protein BJ741DRAFT_616691, partial [Chytriomyces cf. hyalinus JEL632]
RCKQNESKPTTLALHARNPKQQDTCVNVTVCESVHEPPASHLWPSAIVLARLVWHWRKRIKTSGTVIELGCGTGLPGLLVSKLQFGRHVVLMDQLQASLSCAGEYSKEWIGRCIEGVLGVGRV